jgi:chromosome segregation ATPase
VGHVPDTVKVELERLRAELASSERDSKELQENVAALHDEIAQERVVVPGAKVVSELRDEVALAAAEAAQLEESIASFKEAVERPGEP